MAEVIAARERDANKFLKDDEEDQKNKIEHDIEGMGAVSNFLRWGFGRMIKRVEPENDLEPEVDKPTAYEPPVVQPLNEIERRSQLGDFLLGFVNSPTTPLPQPNE